MNKTKAIEILTNAISNLERKNKSQGKEFYKSALRILQDKNPSQDELGNLYRSFCGYLAHGEFTDSEYQEIKQLIDCFDR